jgi:hypothetical protein
MDYHRYSVNPVAARLFGSNISPNFPKTGNWIHTLIVIVIILVILQLLGIL